MKTIRFGLRQNVNLKVVKNKTYFLQLVHLITTQSIKNGVNLFYVKNSQDYGYVIAVLLGEKI